MTRGASFPGVESTSRFTWPDHEIPGYPEKFLGSSVRPNTLLRETSVLSKARDLRRDLHLCANKNRLLDTRK